MTKEKEKSLPCLLSDKEIVGLTGIGKIAHKLAYSVMEEKIKRGDSVEESKKDAKNNLLRLQKLFDK